MDASVVPHDPAPITVTFGGMASFPPAVKSGLGACRRCTRRAPSRRDVVVHAEGVAGKGAQISSFGDSAVLRTQCLEQGLAHLVLESMAVLVSELGGRD